MTCRAKGELVRSTMRSSWGAELTGLGALPFVWYEGCVSDLGMFGTEPLETDEVAYAPEV